jgi:hypothetical protein
MEYKTDRQNHRQTGMLEEFIGSEGPHRMEGKGGFKR